MVLLSCRDLSVGYDGRAVFSNLDFEVGEGDYLAVVGENGAGKSTLIKTLLGLIPPVSGEITTGGGFFRNEIGYLPQQTEVQRDFPASVYEIVLSGCQNRMGWRPFYSKAERARADAAIEKMGISPLKNRCYRELSGGQQQRVLLARALLSTGKLLLLDEPVAGLDPLVTSQMYAIIDELNKKERIAVIMVSHDLSAALGYATHILHVGKESFFGTKDEYLSSKAAGSFLARGGKEDV